MSEPNAKELVELCDPVDTYGKVDARWGYREVQVFEHEGRHWAIPVLVTAGDEGGIEAEGEPFEVRKVPVTGYKWEPVQEPAEEE